jgi:UDP-3-O-[3-hydroxymyristoyl] glucosamine N-acyltransferase
VVALTLSELARRTGAEVRGDARCVVREVAPLHCAKKGAISFLASARFRQYLPQTQASAVILTSEDAHQCPVNALVSENPYACYARVAALLHPDDSQRGFIHPSAIVDASSRIDPGAWIGPGAVIGARATIGSQAFIGPLCLVDEDCEIGAQTRLVMNVSLGKRTRLGQRVLIHPGAVLGADGFGLAKEGERWLKVPQLGGLWIGDDVEIGANTTIDRGALEDTVLEHGVKVDNLVQIGHNVHIGAHTAIAGCVGIAGSARIGAHCTLAGGVGVVGHLEIGDHVHVTGMSMVTRSISGPESYSSGTPLQPTRSWRRNFLRLKQMEEMSRRIRELESRVRELERSGQQEL